MCYCSYLLLLPYLLSSYSCFFIEKAIRVKNVIIIIIIIIVVVYISIVKAKTEK